MKYDHSAAVEFAGNFNRTLYHQRTPDPRKLRVDAQRCFRLARGPASRRLADELEAIGRAFEHEAREIECHAFSGRE